MNIDYFVRNEREAALVAQAEALAAPFAERAAEHDLAGSFPYENFKDLKEAGYLKLSVPRKYGGDEISLYELMLIQERLGRGDGSTALSVGWHLGQMHHYRYIDVWPEFLFANLCKDVVEDGAMINHFSSERNTGSPTRGGRPETTAHRVEGGWSVSGRKTYSTLSPILDRYIVTAYIDELDQIGHFYIQQQDGISIEETWNTIGMRATGSHDLIFKNVFVPDEAYAPTSPKWASDGNGWLMHIPASYLGIAYAARDFSIQFATEYQPKSLGASISTLPHIQHTIAQIEQCLITARTLLYSVADRWDNNPDQRRALGPEMGLAKKTAVDCGIRVTDLAMRIVGGSSLSRDFPLERYYRDARAGLHNPPMEDSIDRMLSSRAIAELESQTE